MVSNMDYTVDNLNTYQAMAAAVRLPTATPEYVQLSLAGETGELLGYIGKAIRDGRKPDYEQHIKKELGDVLWNVAMMAMDNGWTLGDIAHSNIVKLYDRKDRGVLQGSGDNR